MPLIVENLPTNTAYVLGIDYTVNKETHWTTAVTNILLGKYTPFLVHPTKRVRSAKGNVDMAWPLIVRMNWWKTPPPQVVVDYNTHANSREILRRDGYTCCYCGDHALTVDHVKPESRCKRDGDAHNGWTWGNLVAACKDCNGKKRDRTPEEADMKLLWNPHTGRSDKYAHLQAEVWRILEEGGGYVPEAVQVEGLLAR